MSKKEESIEAKLALGRAGEMVDRTFAIASLMTAVAKHSREGTAESLGELDQAARKIDRTGRQVLHGLCETLLNLWESREDVLDEVPSDGEES